MDSVEMSSNGECIEDAATAEVLLPSELSNGYDVFGEPEVQPRVGEEYQAEIPAFISHSDYTWFKSDLDKDDDTSTGGLCTSDVELPIPVMWVPERVDKIKRELQEFNADKSRLSSDDGSLTVDVDDKVKCEEQEDFNTKNEKSGCFLLPGYQYNSWIERDEANFLLGLYIFGKNLIQVRRFMENKSIGEIMSYYYGHFYGTTKYKRWSMCRKMKSRKCIYGQKIFAGLRQQELMSRLFTHMSEECQSKLLEASRSFGEGKISLEEYVFTLKAIAGLSRLVEAIGIGKGKQDLTGMGMEQTKPTQTAALFPEIPIGKACSALTTAEIVTFLTGNFRLSKARSNDLFWEAVWPRLLARGWHSEQPDNGVSRHSLVFLVPGVKKFSKRKLAKGEHYFDSVTDVLNKVASQPSLLDFEAELTNEGLQWTSEVKSDGEDSPNEEERRCYLKPRTSTCSSSDPIKFTIVDTSIVLDSDRKACKVRELRSLPPEICNSSLRNQFGGECNGDAHGEEKIYESNSGNSSTFSMDEADEVSKPVVKVNIEKDFRNNAHKRRTSEFQPKQRTKANSHHAPAGKKRQKASLSGCTERTFSEVDVSVSSRVDPSLEMLSSTNNSPSKENPVNGSEFIDQNPNQLWTMIDLNLPVCPDAELSDQGMAVDSNHDQTKESNNLEQPSTMNQRRQSTRNRPLTTKALEALAFGLFDTKKKRKNRDDFPQEMIMTMPRNARRGRVHQPDESYSTSSMDLAAEEKGCGKVDGGADMFGDVKV